MNTYLQTHQCAKEGDSLLALSIMVQLLSSEVQQLLHNKFVVILGDSVQRSVYKDLVLLLQKDCLLTHSQLKIKGELSFEQDELVDGGQKGCMHNRTNYREVRQYCSGHHLVRFYFLTRVYNEYVQAVLKELQSDKYTPDVVIINSCLWDISRYEQHYIESYQENLENLFRHLHEVVPKSCLVLWNTAMPVGKKVTGGFLPRDQQDLALLLGRKVIEANFYSSTEAKKHGFDVLDLHFHFRREERLRQRDGVHWNQLAHRQLSQLLLAHVADAWGVELPHRDLVGTFKNGPVSGGPDQRIESQSQASRDPLTLPPPPLLPPPRNRPLLPLPTPCLPRPQFLPPQLHPIPCHPVMSPQLEFCPQGTYFSSDHHFQSDQFLNYFHSDVPSSTQTGFDFREDLMFGPQLPRPLFPTSYYQQRAPVVHRGFRRNLRSGPYVRQKRAAQILRETGPSPPRAKTSLD